MDRTTFVPLTDKDLLEEIIITSIGKENLPALSNITKDLVISFNFILIYKSLKKVKKCTAVVDMI